MATKSLKAHIIKYGAVSLAAAGVFILGAYLLNRYFTVRQAVDFEGNKLVASSAKQAKQILPGLLVPEEYGSIDLQLKSIRESEDLLSATYNDVSDSSLAILLRCPKASENTYVCASYLRNQIVTATEVGLPRNILGYLIKHKRLTSRRQDNIMLLSLSALFCGIALVFLGLIASMLLFIEKHIRKPLLNLNQNIAPILDGGIGAELECFNVAELQSVAAQVTQLVRRYEEKKAAFATGELAAQVAHDIRSPLAALDSIVKDVSHLPEEKRVIIRSAVGRIRDIANNLIERNREFVAIAGMAADVASSGPTTTELLSSHLDPLITEKRLQFRSKISVEIDGRLDAASYGLFAAIQPIEFKRMMSNLINNAVEALGDKGIVTIHLFAEESQVLLRVKDSGHGIPPQVLARLGKRGETHGKYGGSGLGLYHARTSVESWGGGLEIASEVGQGTIVTLRLPQARPPEWFVSELELSSNGVIVVLDDDSSIHQVWQGRFDSAGAKEHTIEILHFSTPDQLRGWVKDNAAKASKALYLTDYELLGYEETGLDLVEELNLGERAILVTSRFEEKGILEHCLRLKARMIPKGLAAFVPLTIRPAQICPDAVLLDDDALVHMTWKMAAKSRGLNLAAFRTPQDLLAALERFSKDTVVYLDCDLGDGLRGEDIAKELHARGFTTLYLATGHPPESFPPMPWIKQVVGKEPPWA